MSSDAGADPGETPSDGSPAGSGAGLPLVRVLLGPTGSGKTELAVGLDPARYEIISCDSRQIYREMPIGSAMPLPEELARVRHHLVDFLSPAEDFNAGTFARLARDALGDVLARGKSPVLVGGAGFYYRALKTGLFSRTTVDPGTRERVRGMTHTERLALLREGDPTAVLPDGRPTVPGFIHPHDAYRVERALEILLSTGVPWSEHWRRAREAGMASREFNFTGFYLETDRETYWRRLFERAAQMVGAGLVAEAGRLREAYGDCPGLKTLGYGLALQRLDGAISEDRLIEELAIRHRQYGKRQRTWFRREPELRAVSLSELRKKVVNGRFPDEFLDFSKN